MGNTLSSVSPLTVSAGIGSYVSELGDVQYEKSLGSSRFMKTIRGRHRDGPIVVKIFIKPDTTLSLSKIALQLKTERGALLDVPNAFGYQTIVETEKAGYLVRQYLFSSLYDRISTRPFLDLIEKKWITYQMLCGVAACHARGIYHGDIKSENFLVTSWSWVYLSDFAFFKPTHLPEDNPADFSFFFDTSQRRTCYVAPERFSTALKKATDDTISTASGELNAQMDIFSLGCVIAELFLEGTGIFTLSQLFKYKRGEYSPAVYLDKIEDINIRLMVAEMISLDPTKRQSADYHLQKAREKVFPDYFYTFYHQYISTITDPQNHPLLEMEGVQQSTLPLPKADADEKIERLYHDFDKIAFFLGFLDSTININEAENNKVAYKSCPSSKPFPIKLNIPNYESPDFANPKLLNSPTDYDGALLFLSFLTAHIRNALHSSSKLYAIDMLLAISEYLTDEVKLDRLCPYFVALLTDEIPAVRAASIKALTQILMIVKVITPSNATLLPEYILENARPLATDPEVSVRIMYAQCISPLAETALRFLEMTQALKADGSFDITDVETEAADVYLYEASYDACLQDLRSLVQDHVTTLLTDSDSAVKRALVSDITSLCVFFGRPRANDVLLSHMITYLNDKDWMLRSAFFESIVGVGAFIGGHNLVQFILPLTVQSLADTEEFVIEKVLSSLTSLAELGLFQKMKLWELSGIVAGFICHPNPWIRYGAISFIASASKLQSEMVDRWCLLYGTILPFLKNDISDITISKLLEYAKKPLSRAVMDGAIAWALKAEKSLFWKPVKERGGRFQYSNQKPFSVVDSIAKSDEDKQWLEKLLKLLQMPVEDEFKIAALRDYIYKTAVGRAVLRHEDVAKSAFLSNHVIPLKNLNITPQNVFFNEIPSESSQQLLTEAMDGIAHRHDGVGTAIAVRRGSHSSASTTTRVEAVNHRHIRRDGNSKEELDELTRMLSSKPLVMGIGCGSNTPQSNSSSPIPINSPKHHQPVSSLSHEAGAPPSPTGSVSSMSTMTSVKRATGLRTKSGGRSIDFEKAAPAISTSSTTVQGLMNINSDNHSASGHPPSIRMLTGRDQGVVLDPPGVGQQPISSYVSSSYDGNDRHIRHLLEYVYMEAFPRPDTRFGPKVHLPNRRRVIRSNTGSRVSSHGWKPQGTLIAHLNEHRGVVNQIAIAPDHAFFATCGDDGTVKIWDSLRLEKNVTNRSRLTYSLLAPAKIKCIVFISESHSIASSADDGSIHVFRVDYTANGVAPKYSKPQTIIRYTFEGHGEEYGVCMEHVMMDSVSTLFVATTKSRVVAIDLLSLDTTLELKNPVHFGPITAMCIDFKRTWLLVGTSRGILTLFDLRFGVRLKSWTVGDGVYITKLVVHPRKGRGRFVVMASSLPEIQIIDLEQATCRERYQVVQPVARQSNSRTTSMEVNNMSMKGVSEDMSEELERIMKDGFAEKNGDVGGGDNVSSVSGASAVLSQAPAMMAFCMGLDVLGSDGHPGREDVMQPEAEHEGLGAGFMIVGGTDRKLRFWDLSKVEASLIISGLDLEEPRPTYMRQSNNIYVELHAGQESTGQGTVTTSTSSGSGATGGSSIPSGTSGVSSNVHPRRKTMRMTRATIIAQQQQHLLKNHLDTITDVAVLAWPYGIVISADRSGIIKVYE